MARTDPNFTMGIEEEYLLVDRDTCELAAAPRGLMEGCAAELEDQVSPEFLQCQIEIGTKVCHTIGQAREDLKRLRDCVSRHAAKYGLAPIAASCHPFADWKDQSHTDKDRYNALSKDLAGVVRRMLICGMHVHVGIDEKDQRIDIINQLTYFLPHLLALSASSPFWQGEDTGLASYRVTVFDNLPRTGLPPHLNSWGEYERSVQALIELGVIEDSSKIWWDLRPSAHFPTLESRICDVSPRLEHALAIAALTQAITRMLWRISGKNQRWRTYDNFLVAENRWRAQRYGVAGGLIDFGRREIVPMKELVEELVELLQEDADALTSRDEIERALEIIRSGTSSDRQRAVYKSVCKTGAPHEAGLKAVVNHLIDEFHHDL